MHPRNRRLSGGWQIPLWDWREKEELQSNKRHEWQLCGCRQHGSWNGKQDSSMDFWIHVLNWWVFWWVFWTRKRGANYLLINTIPPQWWVFPMFSSKTFKNKNVYIKVFSKTWEKLTKAIIHHWFSADNASKNRIKKLTFLLTLTKRKQLLLFIARIY